MIFAPFLAEKVLTGEKTVTRRRLTHHGGRPIGYKAGGIYAVQPGRGKPHLGHIEVLTVEVQPLAMMGSHDCEPEGFANLDLFEAMKAGRSDVADAILEHRVGLRAPRVVIVTGPDGRRTYDLQEDADV